MARLFDITTTSDTASTAPAGTVRMVFTVTNTAQRPLRGSLRAKALDSGQAGWLAIDGDAERDFPPGGAHQVTVNAKVPAGTAAGKFRVRLDALSVANPDDDFTEGPAVSVTVTGAPEKKEGGGVPWWVWLIIGVVLLAIIGGVLAFVLMGKKKEPDVDKPPIASEPAASQPAVSQPVPEGLPGKTFAEAKQQLEALGLTVAAERVNSFDSCPDKVIKTTPAAGAAPASGVPVTVSVTALASGPDTCKPGFVTRAAAPGDTACVTPEARAQVIVDNGAQADRREFVVPSPKELEDLKKEHPQSGAVEKAPFSLAQQFVLRDRSVFVTDAVLGFRKMRCKAQYTERRATAEDRACVSTTTQIATDADTRASDSRKVCPRK